PLGEEDDPLLDRFMPAYDVVERHEVPVDAPASVTLAAARDVELSSVPGVRAVFKAREVMLGAAPDRAPRSRALLAEMLSLGWGVLAEEPGREIVIGGAPRRGEANVPSRPIAPAAFAAFAEPGYVKIAWTLRADAVGDEASIFRTETRAIATD